MYDILNSIKVIAGPCSAESKEQVLSLAESLSAMGVKIFRAGVWKPRSSPDSFEGVGEKALDWLVCAKEKFGLRIAIEVANREHLLKAIDKGIDMVWIGSRSTANPFVVQEIADTITYAIAQSSDFGEKSRGGKGKIDLDMFTVIIKNPVNPDISLWCGAIERIMATGVKNIILVHRGFTSYERSLYRNSPLWNIAIEIKRRYPLIPILCDPSHIGGKREYIFQISQQAIDLMFDGLMIEVHPNPDEALSDSLQQVTPDQLRKILEGLNLRKAGKLPEYIGALREEIDEIDKKVIALLGERIKISTQIGDCKKENNLPIFQNERYSKMLENRKTLSAQTGLSEEFIENLMKLIHSYSVEEQLRK